MKIYLIRHGETEYNRKKLFYGSKDVSINATGIIQSEQLNKKINLPLTYPIIISGLKRTHETAQLIFPNHHYIEVSGLNEKSFGKWEGLNANQIQAKYPEAWASWLKAPFAYTPPLAENFTDFENRVLKAMEKLVSQNHSCVVITHIGVIRVWLHSLFPEKNFWDIELTQGNYTCIDCSDGKFTIDVWNQ